MKKQLLRRLADEAGQSFIDDILDANPAVARRCRAIQWVWLTKEPNEPGEAEVDLAARYPHMYVTEIRNLLRPEFIARLGDVLRHRLPARTPGR